MHYYIYRDAEQAKADLMPLFALKSNLKSHISIWKPGFERYVCGEITLCFLFGVLELI
jgi:hypothetical protein